MVFRDFLGVTTVFSVGDDGFLELRRVSGCGGIVRNCGGFFGGRGGGFLYDHSGFRPVRERSCYPSVLPCTSPEAGGSGGVEAGFLRQWPGCRVRLEFQRGHNGVARMFPSASVMTGGPAGPSTRCAHDRPALPDPVGHADHGQNAVWRWCP